MLQTINSRFHASHNNTYSYFVFFLFLAAANAIAQVDSHKEKTLLQILRTGTAFISFRTRVPKMYPAVLKQAVTAKPQPE